MSKKEGSKSKVLWSILFGFVTIILCYLFVVVYFFYISPYNISLKVSLWPFMSDYSIGEMYLDATMEIKFTVTDEITFEETEKSVVGVNIRQDGYIVAPYNEFRFCNDDTQITILANSGKVYDGKLLYGDMNYDIAVLKCENVLGEEGEIKIPYVSISKSSLYSSVIAVGSPMKTKTVWTGAIVDTNLTNIYSSTEIEGKNAVDFIIEDCYTVELKESTESFGGGAIFNDIGGLLGLSFDKTLSDGSYVIIPIDDVDLFLNDVVKNYKKQTQYKNVIVDSVVGFDKTEIYCYTTVANSNVGQEEYFYFNNSWQVFTDEIIAFAGGTTEGYYLFEDWVYDGRTVLGKNNVISSIKIGYFTRSADTKTELVRSLYQIEKGNKGVIYYYELGTLGTQLKSVSFVF